jgi:serine protease Do
MRTYTGFGIALLTAAFLMTPVFGQEKQHLTFQSKEASYLGIGVQDVDSERARTLKLKEERGAEITSVEPDSPASKMGIKPGDVILDYNGTPVQGMAHLQRLVMETPAGRTVKLNVWRSGASLTLTGAVGQRKGMWLETGDGSMNMVLVPPTPMAPPAPMSLPGMVTMMPSSMLGIEGEPLNREPQFAEFMGAKDGVLVKAVGRNSAAEKAGIRAGDVIVKVDDTHVSTSADITTAIRAAHGKRTFNLTLVRSRKEMPLTVNLDDR